MQKVNKQQALIVSARIAQTPVASNSLQKNHK
jgi:hypothetical protein